MRNLWLSTVLVAVIPLTEAKESMIQTSERNGRIYVSATSLTKGANVAVKNLPGQEQIVVCSNDRCAAVKEFVREGDETLISVAALSKALGATARFDETRQHVSFDFSSKVKTDSATVARVGQLAPNFRLTKLDGSPVALADFRGKRVLINSWASW